MLRGRGASALRFAEVPALENAAWALPPATGGEPVASQRAPKDGSAGRAYGAAKGDLLAPSNPVVFRRTESNWLFVRFACNSLLSNRI